MAQEIEVSDEVKDVSIRITNKLIEMGYVPDCTDTDNDDEFDVQDMIREVISQSDLSNLK
jgi:hypothetical protein